MMTDIVIMASASVKPVPTDHALTLHVILGPLGRPVNLIGYKPSRSTFLSYSSCAQREGCSFVIDRATNAARLPPPAATLRHARRHKKFASPPRRWLF